MELATIGPIVQSFSVCGLKHPDGAIHALDPHMDPCTVDPHIIRIRNLGFRVSVEQDPYQMVTSEKYTKY